MPTSPSPDVLGLVAERFRALAEPARLHLLGCLQDGERSVSGLVEATGLGQANVSKHLQLLHALGFVSRHRRGAHVYYALADQSVFTVCDMMCGRIEAALRAQQALLAP